MKLLIVSATREEIESLLLKFNQAIEQSNTLYSIVCNNHSIDILISGVGMVSSVYAVCKQLSKNKYDLAINVGIAGSFKQIFPIGSVLNVVEDNFSELGAEEGNEVVPLKNLNIAQTIKNNNLYKESLADTLPIVCGITVNTVHGNITSIQKVVNKFNPDVETMEGASFLYACHIAETKCLQIRSVSNYVEERNKAKWNIPIAVKNLTDFLWTFINSL